MSGTGWRAWYSPKLGDNWDLGWSTKLTVFTWHDVAVTGGSGVEIHGFVMNPANTGTSGGLVPADDITVQGADGRPQYFLTYVPEDDDEACRFTESLLE
jgi:hypothetical protein